MYKLLLKPLFFLFDPEFVHHTVFKLIKLSNKIPGISNVIRWIYVIKDKRLERHLFGLNFPNPVGLAAGFDKDAKLYHELSNFGFGFIEIGTLTPKPQDGNPKKRIFRLTEDKGLINRLGFNNEGVRSAINRLKKNKGVLIGGNIGENKLLLITTIQLIDEYFDLKKRVTLQKSKLDEISNKFKQIKSLAIEYKKDKDVEIQSLHDELENLKKIIEKNNNLYESMLDKTAQSLEKIISNTESLSKIQ